MPLKEVAEQAAEQARAAEGTTFALAAIVHETTAEGQKLTEIGIALASAAGTRSRSSSWGAERTDGHIWVTTQALSELWRALAGLASPRPA